MIDWRYASTYTYDPRGNLVFAMAEYDDGADGIDLRETWTLTYDSRGNLVHAVYESDPGADGTINYRDASTHTYDSRGNRVQSVREAGWGADGTIDYRSTVTYAYDSRGRLVQWVREDDGDADGTIDYRETLSYEYDGSGAPPRALLLNARAELPTAAPAPRLHAAAPNPFRHLTTLGYALPGPAQVELRIHDIGGRLVRVLASGPQPGGEHRVVWDGTDESGRSVAGGAYFARLRVGDRETSKHVMRIR